MDGGARRAPVRRRGRPGIVRFFFPGGTEWVFARELLEAGLRSPQRSGDIGIWPCGRAQVVVEFHSADGVAVVQFDNTPLMRFLRGTYAEAPRAVRHEEPLRPERPARPSVRR